MGKSYLITVLSTALCNIATATIKSLSLTCAASTEVAVFKISRQTTYTLLCLSVQQLFKDLSAASLILLQQKFRNIHYLIIDKKLMIGQIQIG
jgi:hypothetical protein